MGITGISTSGQVSLGNEVRLAGASGHQRFSNWSVNVPTTPDAVSLDILGKDHFNPFESRPVGLYSDFISGPEHKFRYLSIRGLHCTVNITSPTNQSNWTIVSGTGTSPAQSNTLPYIDPAVSDPKELSFRAISTQNWPSVSMTATNFSYGASFAGWQWCDETWAPFGGIVSFSTNFTLYNSQATEGTYIRLKAVCFI